MERGGGRERDGEIERWRDREGRERDEETWGGRERDGEIERLCYLRTNKV